MLYDKLQSQIHEVESRIAEHSAELRQALEELAELAAKLEDKEVEHEDDKEQYIAPDGTYYKAWELSDMADDVNDIENQFSK